MKYNHSEIAPSGKRRYSLYMGISDMEIMKGLTEKALLSMPLLDKSRFPDYNNARQRMRQMHSSLLKALQAAYDLDDDGEKVRKENTDG